VITGLEKLRRLAMMHYPYTTAIRLAKHVVTTSEWKARVAHQPAHDVGRIVWLT